VSREKGTVAVLDCGSSKVDALMELVDGAGARPERIALDRARDALTRDAVIISGGPRLFTAEPQLIDAFAFVDELSVPALGICLGHQAIAMRKGGGVFLGVERRAPEVLTLERTHPLVAGLPPSVTVVEDHCEGVTLPGGFICIASSAHYAVEIMACDESRLYGVQWHPEVSGDVGFTLLVNFLALAGV
jgi:GMP synthase-like glutamine amidotransferase